MNIGYIRVSRDKQTTALQEDAIQQAQCERVFTDKMSGVCDDRPQFLAMLDMARRERCHYCVATRSPGPFIKTTHRDGDSTQRARGGTQKYQRKLIPRHQRASSCSTSLGRWRNLSAMSSRSALWPDSMQHERVDARVDGQRRRRPSSHALSHLPKNSMRLKRRVLPNHGADGVQKSEYIL